MDKAKVKSIRLNKKQHGILIDGLDLMIDVMKENLKSEYHNLENSSEFEFEEDDVQATMQMESDFIATLQLMNALKKITY